MENSNTARNFALQLGSLIALYSALSAIIMVVFGAITLLFPDQQSFSYEYQSAQSSLRFGIALMIVFFPTYIVLTRIVNRIRRNEHGTYLILTKWLVYLSLLVGGVILLGDVVTTVLAYLNGEITLRFILKALTLLIVIGAAFFYYIKDAQSYWLTYEKQSKQYAFAACLLAMSVLVLGFWQSDTPTEIRDLAADEIQTQNLQDMQYRIENHYRITKILPQTIAELYTGVEVPKAPTKRESYTFTIIDSDTYQLCATYVFSSDRANGNSNTTTVTKPVINQYDNWDHAAGKTCFERTIVKDPMDSPKALPM